ncbi:hypothetical protein [Xenorhabdus bovienii]|uniref:hypothetical protein n=1 Tax=Xenorhabdus bovienii TaxID=40576 RepID=UPI00237C95F8|nr:hypothetical protein [Xenorhabdus bovienii]
MIEIDDYPNLDHWRTVQEFSIEQVALLLAAIDPFESSLLDVRDKRHPRWKYAWGFAKGLETAIRRGILTPVVCFGERSYSEAPWEITLDSIRPTDRSLPLSFEQTIITRDSMNEWAKTEKVSYFIPRRKINIEVVKYEAELVIENKNKEEIKLLPRYEHKSEGLDFVDEAIEQLWSTYDENDPSTAPNKPEVISFLELKGASGNMANAIDLILRPNSIRSKGRPPKRKG